MKITRTRALRWGVIALWTYATGLAAGAAAISAMLLVMAYSAGGFDQTEVLQAVLVLGFYGFWIALLGSTIALPFAIRALEHAELRRTVPRIALRVVGVAALVGPTGILAAPVAVVMGIALVLGMSPYRRRTPVAGAGELPT